MINHCIYCLKPRAGYILSYPACEEHIRKFNTEKTIEKQRKTRKQK